MQVSNYRRLQDRNKYSDDIKEKIKREGRKEEKEKKKKERKEREKKKEKLHEIPFGLLKTFP